MLDGPSAQGDIAPIFIPWGDRAQAIKAFVSQNSPYASADRTMLIEERASAPVPRLRSANRQAGKARAVNLLSQIPDFQLRSSSVVIPIFSVRQVCPAGAILDRTGPPDERSAQQVVER